MSNIPEPPRALAVLDPALPEIPDRLLRARWLASTDDRFGPMIYTISTFIVIPDPVE